MGALPRGALGWPAPGPCCCDTSDGAWDCDHDSAVLTERCVPCGLSVQVGPLPPPPPPPPRDGPAEAGRQDGCEAANGGGARGPNPPPGPPRPPPFIPPAGRPPEAWLGGRKGRAGMKGLPRGGAGDGPACVGGAKGCDRGGPRGSATAPKGPRGAGSGGA
jgi:hypothetical protein